MSKSQVLVFPKDYKKQDALNMSITKDDFEQQDGKYKTRKMKE